MKENIKCTYDELVPINQLKEHPKNPNKHPDAQIERLATIIDYQGCRKPIVVSKLSGLMTRGHGTLMSMKLLDWEHVPVNYQDYDDEAQEYADMVADNGIAEWSKQDFAQINDEFTVYGPDLDVELLGLQNFTIEPMDNIELVNSGDEQSEWVDMPDFTPGEKEIRLTLLFQTELQREEYVKDYGIEVTNKHSGQWISRI